eukprot:tig00021489_g21672.t1
MSAAAFSVVLAGPRASLQSAAAVCAACSSSSQISQPAASRSAPAPARQFAGVSFEASTSGLRFVAGARVAVPDVRVAKAPVAFTGPVADLKGCEEKMKKTLDSVQGNFNSVRTGRANVSLMDRIVVDYYGAPTPLKSLASVATPDASTIVVSVFDKGAVQSIEKAIQTSDLGLTPNTDGSTIRLSVPPLTTERRKELAKTVKKLAEDGKVALRNIRRDGIDAVRKKEKAGDLSKDLAKDEEDKIQKTLDKFIKQLDEMTAKKEKEIEGK